MIDYKAEQKKLSEGGNFWKPKSGQHKVKALTELEETEPFVRKDKDTGKEESSPQYKIKILVNGEEKTWTMGKGLTLASLHGQLVDLAVKNGNTLINKEFTVAVKNDGTKNDYTIVA